MNFFYFIFYFFNKLFSVFINFAPIFCEFFIINFYKQKQAPFPGSLLSACLRRQFSILISWIHPSGARTRPIWMPVRVS